MAPTITNKHNAPQSLVDFAKKPHYFRGDSDYTVTQLIDSPRIRILRDWHSDKIEDDVYENIFRLVGTAIHSIVEDSSDSAKHWHPKATSVKEERIFIEREQSKVSGAIDIQYRNEDGTLTIGDYKFTSSHSLRFPEKWEKQLNLYRFLVENANGNTDHPVVSRLEVYAILRDWSFRTAQRDRDYPQTPGVTVPIRLWSKDETEDYFSDRLNVHMSADLSTEFAGSPPSCTKEDMWEKDPTYAVKKKDRVRAVRVLDSMEEATQYLFDKDDDKLFIEKREGERTRCQHFCDVAKFCDQWCGF
jgi:histone H3/H4